MEVEDGSSIENHRASKRLGLTNTIQASFGLPDDPDYVFDIVASGDSSVMAVSLSTNAIKLYSPVTGQYLGDCLGHDGTISEISFSDFNSPWVLNSCSVDGTLRAWDTRNHQQVSILRGNVSSQEMFSFSIGGSSGDLVAAGSQAQGYWLPFVIIIGRYSAMAESILVYVLVWNSSWRTPHLEEVLFWDWRNQKQVACLQECHMEDVTQVRFDPSRRDRLISGSVDGLMCVFDTKGDINDDDQLESVMNVGTSIAKLGFFGPANKKLWCLTHIETLSVWNWEDALQEAVFDNARAISSANWNLPQVDYFVDCHYSLPNDSLWLIGGTNDGSLGYFPVNYSRSNGQSQPGSGVIGPVSAVLEGGHTGIVRSIWLPFNMGTDLGLGQGVFGWTGGEDGRLCCWSEGHISGKTLAWISTRLVMKTSKSSKQHRHRPY